MVVPTARAELANVDLGATLYTKWLFRNNDTQGLLTYGNPFWPDNIEGDNGVGTEFELRVLGRVGPHVQAGARIKSRWGALWQDWWENGDIRYGGEHNTSGESLGMNHAQYMKLRGYWVRLAPPLPGVDGILVGSTDLSMFNPWTIGKVRYIDRDNAKGTFVEGSFAQRAFAYQVGIVALPKLYVGPGWSTGIGDTALDNPFYANDYAYALRLDARPTDWIELTAIGTTTLDLEIDFTDPDAKGTLYPDCTDALGNPVPGCEAERDGATGTFVRYLNAVTTLEARLEPTYWLSIDVLGGLSMQRLDPQLVTNGVATSQGFFPMPFADIDFGDGSHAVRVRVELFDPFEVGLSLHLEYFNIGENWTSVFAARREADVLLTDGLVEGGQVPTLNIANEFMDFDEPFYESIVGWHGATAIVDLAWEALDLSAEYTLIGYNTDAQGRDVETVYPDFTFTDGFTDTDIFDYANRLDRGRDPRAVYRRDQDRITHVAVLQGHYVVDLGRGLEITSRFKLVFDQDLRNHQTEDDDYTGWMLQGRLWLAYPLTDELRVAAGFQIDRWRETHRDGTLQLAAGCEPGDATCPVLGATYQDVDTDKEKVMASIRYDFEGVHFQYALEYVHKAQRRSIKPDQTFRIFRSKATLEVSF